MTDNRTCVRRGHALIIRDDPQRYVEVMGADRNSAGAPFQYAESLFVALAMVKSMTGLPYRSVRRAYLLSIPIDAVLVARTRLDTGFHSLS